MKITIIGGGNMGGAIARGLAAKGVVEPGQLTVADPSESVRAALAGPLVATSEDNALAARGADLIIVAVKPWLMEQVCTALAPAIDPARQAVVSIAAGITFDQMRGWLGSRTPALFRVIPNTAIALAQSVTFIAAAGATPGQAAAVKALFEPLGTVFEVKEEEVTAVTALASCGIAYALRYIDAAARGGEQLGLPYGMAQRIVMQTAAGALALLETNGTAPQTEIDKVTTPGGITLKGLEAMERAGFSDAVIDGLKASK